MVLMSAGTTLTGLISSAIETILDETDGRRLGIVLSGGLDSSTVACIANTIRAGIPTFTGYYDEPGFDERAYAHLVVDGLDQAEHWDIKITPENFIEHFDGMRASLKPPILGMGSFGQYVVAKFLSDHGIEIAMSGEGSDELFGGYARQMIVAGEKPPEGYENYLLPEGYPIDLKAALDYDYAALPDLLAVDDQMLGAWGLEARAPFTDERIVEYGLGLPITERVGKRHLREAVRGIVPDEIIDRKDKQGFPAPLVAWSQREPVRSFVLDRIGYVPDPSNPWARGWWLTLCSQ